MTKAKCPTCEYLVAVAGIYSDGGVQLKPHYANGERCEQMHKTVPLDPARVLAVPHWVVDSEAVAAERGSVIRFTTTGGDR